MSPWLQLRYVPGDRGEDFFDIYFWAVRTGRDKEFVAGYVYDVSPVNDDSPFFFEDYKWGVIFRMLVGLRSGYVLDIAEGIETREPVALYILAACIGQAALLAFSGFGSLLAGRLPWRNHRVILSSICAIVAILVVYRLALDALLNATLGARPWAGGS